MEHMACRATLTKAMINTKGDDQFFNRLLSYFQSQFTEKIIQFYPIRSLVFYLETEKNTYILKGYRSNKRLKLQEAFTETLRKEGFLKTYKFVAPPAKESLYFEGLYFGSTLYINPNKTPFSFHTGKSREDGLALLTHFHRVTGNFETRYRRLLSKADIYEKWTERMNIFLTNLPYLSYFLNEPLTAEIVSWGNWALKGLQPSQAYFLKEPLVILHGDVAHHNFLRDAAGDLYLIDFDLISIGPAVNDYVQFANRILPFLDWSFEKLAKLSPFDVYLQDQAFLYALAFPADLYREWNRIVREKSFSDQSKIQHVMDLTIGQFYARKKFIDVIREKT
jgi:hypothetical protein